MRWWSSIKRGICAEVKCLWYSREMTIKRMHL